MQSKGCRMFHWISLVFSFERLFEDRRTNIVAYKDAIFNQKGCPKDHLIKGK